MVDFTMEDAMKVDLNKLAREDPLLLDKCRQDTGGGGHRHTDNAS